MRLMLSCINLLHVAKKAPTAILVSCYLRPFRRRMAIMMIMKTRLMIKKISFYILLLLFLFHFYIHNYINSYLYHPLSLIIIMFMISIILYNIIMYMCMYVYHVFILYKDYSHWAEIGAREQIDLAYLSQIKSILRSW